MEIQKFYLYLKDNSYDECVLINFAYIEDLTQIFYLSFNYGLTEEQYIWLFNLWKPKLNLHVLLDYCFFNKNVKEYYFDVFIRLLAYSNNFDVIDNFAITKFIYYYNIFGTNLMYDLKTISLFRYINISDCFSGTKILEDYVHSKTDKL